MRKDLLAAGMKSAKFAGGIGENDIDRNRMSDEEAAALDAETAKIVVEKKPIAKKVFRPLGATILVRQLADETLSPILQGVESVTQEKPSEGIVIAAGFKAVDIAAGDHVVFGKYSGTEFKLNGEVLLLMSIEDIKGTVEDEPKKIDWPTAGGCIVGRA